MKRFFTSSTLFRLLMAMMLTGSYSSANAQKTAMNFLTGQSYNLDVIIDGNVPSPNPTNWPYTTGVIDTVFSKSPSTISGIYLRYSLISDATFATGLPVGGGPITSANPQLFTPTAPVYNLAAVNVDNAMHLSNTVADTFMFTDSSLIGDIYLLGAAGGEPGTSATVGNAGAATVTFLLKDPVTGVLSTQVVSGVVFPNYRDSTSSLRYAKSNIGRYNVQANLSFLEGDGSRPRLFDIRVPLLYTNYNKQIRGVRIQKTSGDQIAVFGVCVDNNPCLPTASVVMDATPTPKEKITSANPIRWKKVDPLVSSGYDVSLEAFPNETSPFTAATMPLYPSAAAVAQSGSFNSNANDTVFTPTGLIPNTVYVLFVRSKCSSTDKSVWNAVSFKTPDCATPTGITWEASALLSRTTTSLRLKWNKQTIYTAASPTHIQFEYILTEDPTYPLPTATGTLTTDTLFHFQNLRTCGLYYLWVRNNCTGNSWGPWVKNASAFQVQCCPSAGNPDTLPGSMSQTGFTMFWPGNKDSAITSYQYQLVVATPGLVDHNNWINTNDTFVTFPNASYPIIKAGQIYKFYVRSYCSDTASAAVPPSKTFSVPWYDCDTPSTPVITNLNMHGAQIDWSPGGSPAPYPILNYNLGITTTTNPPSLRASTQYPPINNYYITVTDTFFHPTNLAANTNYCVHIRTECDSVYRNPSNPNVQPIYNQSAPWKTICFKTPDTCTPPVTPTISNIQATSMHAEWNLYYGIAGYEYYIDQQPNDPTTGTWPLISYNQVDPMNLFSGTNYWFHLRTKCNATAYSPWTNTPFTTLALCSSVSPAPALQQTGGSPNPAATSAIFTWPAIPYADAYDCAVTQSSAPPAAPDATISITSYTATGLIPNTNYYFHLKANCSPNDATGWVSIPFKTDSTTGITEVFHGSSVIVYPNPTNDDITVDIQNNSKGTIQVLDMTGKVIYATETTDKKTIINMKPFASGVYMVKYFTDQSNIQMIRVQKL